jgi:hypothetical protein
VGQLPVAARCRLTPLHQGGNSERSHGNAFSHAVVREE